MSNHLNNKIMLVTEYKPEYTNSHFAHYERSDGSKINFFVHRDDAPDESTLYRLRHDGRIRHDEMLMNGKWVHAPLFYSYQFDGLLDEITLEEAQKLAIQINEHFIE